MKRARNTRNEIDTAVSNDQNVVSQDLVSRKYPVIKILWDSNGGPPAFLIVDATCRKWP